MLLAPSEGVVVEVIHLKRETKKREEENFLKYEALKGNMIFITKKSVNIFIILSKTLHNIHTVNQNQLN